MSGHYIRRYDGEPIPRGWGLVQFPDWEDEPAAQYVVVEPLATEMRKMLMRGEPETARALLFWFDTTEEDKP